MEVRKLQCLSSYRCATLERIDESLSAINREWLYVYVHDAFIISLLV